MTGCPNPTCIGVLPWPPQCGTLSASAAIASPAVSPTTEEAAQEPPPAVFSVVPGSPMTLGSSLRVPSYTVELSSCPHRPETPDVFLPSLPWLFWHLHCIKRKLPGVLWEQNLVWPGVKPSVTGQGPQIGNGPLSSSIPTLPTFPRHLSPALQVRSSLSPPALTRPCHPQAGFSEI